MHCKYCGKDIVADNRYCANCGKEQYNHEGKTNSNTEAKEENVSKKIDSIKETKETANRKKTSCGDQILGVIAFVAAFALGKYLGMTYFLLIIPGILGWYLASWYVKKTIHQNKLTKFIAWSNLITWFIPIVGFFTSAASIKFNESFGKKDKKYIILGIIGLAFSLINAIAGALKATGYISF